MNLKFIKMRLILKRLQTKRGFKCVIILISLVILSSLLYLFWYKQAAPPKKIIKKMPFKKDIGFQCHYLKGNDALPAIDKTITFPSNSIFFIESSCKALTSRQACSIESAARANPDWQVTVLFTSPITWEKFKGNAISTLLSIDNVEAARIHLETYAEETPLYTKFKLPVTQDDLNMDLADILKYLTIYKYNGIYLALDVIVARSFKDLGPNWVVKQSPATLSSDMFSFSDNMDGKTLADIALNILLRDLARQERHNLWSFDTASVMKKLMQMWCTAPDIMFLKSKTCPGVKVLEPEYFYPIPFHERQKYFTPMEWQKWKKYEIYTYQFWDHFTKYLVFNENTLYGHIAKEYCPMVYKTYGKRFGTL